MSAIAILATAVLTAQDSYKPAAGVVKQLNTVKGILNDARAMSPAEAQKHLTENSTELHNAAIEAENKLAASLANVKALRKNLAELTKPDTAKAS